MRSSPKPLLLYLLLLLPQQQLRALDLLSAGAGALSTAALLAAVAMFNPTPPNVTINQTTLSNNGNGVLYATLASPAKNQARKASWGLSNPFHDMSTQDYIKCAVAAAGIGYGYAVYTVVRLQQYLQEKARISFWFNQYDFNKLLLMDQQQMHNLLVQEFIAAYNVRDQKTLKEGIHQFIGDITSEITALESYITILNRIELAGSYGQYCGAAGSSVIKTLIPFGLGKVVLGCLPQLSTHALFFVDAPLKDAVQERISRLHYYKNIFLQSAIDV